MLMTAADRNIFESLVSRLVTIGQTPIALYGAGRVARQLEPAIRASGAALVGIIDDDPNKQGCSWAGLPVLSFDAAISNKVKSVIITAEGAMQDKLWANRGRFRELGIQVLTCPPRFVGKTWDECLIDHFEHKIAQTNGLQLAYPHSYPPRDAKPSEWLLAPLKQSIRPNDTVCEIGTGGGMWTAELIERVGKYYAVDYSERLLFEAMEHRFAKHLPKLHLIHDETARLNGVPDKSIDVLFSYDVFVHFKMDLVHQFIASARRVLKPTGHALIHFATWNQAAIRVWETEHTAHHGGGMSIIYYNHIDWLKESARRLELSVEQVGDVVGAHFLARFQPLK